MPCEYLTKDLESFYSFKLHGSLLTFGILLDMDLYNIKTFSRYLISSPLDQKIKIRNSRSKISRNIFDE